MTDTATPESTTRRSVRRALRTAGGSLRVLWVVARVAVIVAAIAVVVAWKSYGYVPVAVMTGSMRPTYPPHTLLFVHEVPASSIRKGDVITFDPPGPVGRTTHRVVERERHAGRWYFVTKGDANPVADDWRSAESGRPLGDSIHERGVSYATGSVPRTEFAVPQAGRLAAIGGVPHLRAALLALPFLVVAWQLLAWIWRSDDEPVDPPSEDAPVGDAPPESEPARSAA